LTDHRRIGDSPPIRVGKPWDPWCLRTDPVAGFRGPRGRGICRARRRCALAVQTRGCGGADVAAGPQFDGSLLGFLHAQAQRVGGRHAQTPTSGPATMVGSPFQSGRRCCIPRSFSDRCEVPAVHHNQSTRPDRRRACLGRSCHRQSCRRKPRAEMQADSAPHLYRAFLSGDHARLAIALIHAFGHCFRNGRRRARPRSSKEGNMTLDLI
jgi:hypothetical protein